MLRESYQVLEQLRNPEHVYYASDSPGYRYIWIRDCIYMSLPYVNKANSRYEQTYYRLLDLFMEYEWKLDAVARRKPEWEWEYLHARYSPELKEIHSQSWGHAQHDMIGAFLFGLGLGIQNGKNMLRGDDDRRVVRKLIDYLAHVEYWCDPDNGMWEEVREVHASSVGACVAGLRAVEKLVDVPERLIERGVETLTGLLPAESASKPVDLALLSLIYPYRVVPNEIGETVVRRVEERLLRGRGVTRYEGDSYYSSLEKEHGRGRSRTFYMGTEAEWTFGLPWLALCHLEYGDINQAWHYLKQTESVMIAPGVLPELYYSWSDEANPNTPLGWSSAMYILAREALETVTRAG